MANRGTSSKTSPSVIWSDAVDPDGQMMVPIEPEAFVADIRTNGYPLPKGHDPGAPLGEIIDAAAFIGPDRTRFIAEIYSMGAHISVLLTYTKTR
jgi:hypothetical protein